MDYLEVCYLIPKQRFLLLLFTTRLIPLWSDEIVCMIFKPWTLWSNTWSYLLNIPCTLEEKNAFCYEWLECFICQLLIFVNGVVQIFYMLPDLLLLPSSRVID